LTAAREHPPAVTVRQQQRDLGFLIQFMRDLSRRQSEVFLLTSRFLAGYHPPELQPLLDDDVAEAAAALAATYETAARGVIYEHRPASLPAERLLAALKPILAEAGKGGGTAYERDVSTVLRRLEEACRQVWAADPGNRRAFLDLLSRVIRKDAQPDGRAEERETSRLIVP
jgi:hypothetical protein